jgi:hypothetical protein
VYNLGRLVNSEGHIRIFLLLVPVLVLFLNILLLLLFLFLSLSFILYSLYLLSVHLFFSSIVFASLIFSLSLSSPYHSPAPLSHDLLLRLFLETVFSLSYFPCLLTLLLILIIFPLVHVFCILIFLSSFFFLFLSCL